MRYLTRETNIGGRMAYLTNQDIPHFEIVKSFNQYQLMNHFLKMSSVTLYFKIKMPNLENNPKLADTLISWGIDYPIKWLVLEVVKISKIERFDIPDSSEYRLSLTAVVRPNNNSACTVMVENFDPQKRTGNLIPGVIS